ncbi:MAG: cupin domain-containing protein [Fimbriimonadaceae bacterium]
MIWTNGLTEKSAIWSIETEDLDVTLLSWDDCGGVAPHVNSEVDVVMIVLSGSGLVKVGDEQQNLDAGAIIVIPKSLKREVHCTSKRLTYLNVHKRRRKMQPNMVRPSIAEGREDE